MISNVFYGMEEELDTYLDYPKFISDEELQLDTLIPTFSPIMTREKCMKEEDADEENVRCAICDNKHPISLCFKYTLNLSQFICLNCSIYFPHYRLVDWQHIQKPMILDNNVVKCERCGCYKTLDRFKISKIGKKRQKECSYCSLKKKRKYILQKLKQPPN